MSPTKNWNVVAGDVEDLSVALDCRRDGGQRLVGAVDRDLGVPPDALALPGAGAGGGRRPKCRRRKNGHENYGRNYEPGKTGT